MELRHVRYFVAVAEHRHFGRAAAVLHTAQPSLSHQVRQLENEIGVPLFDRTTRSLRLTAAGEVFLREARLLLAQATGSIEQTRAVAKGERGHLNIAFVSGAMGTGALSQLILDFRETHPDVTLDVRPMAAASQIEALQEGHLHVGFFTAGYREAEFGENFLWRERLVIAIPEKHPYASIPQIHFSDLCNRRVLICARTSGSHLHNAVIAILHEMQIEPDIVYQGGDAETIIGLVAAGVGLSLVPNSWMVFAFPGVVFRPIEPLQWLEPGVSMYWNARHESPLVEQFVGSVRRSVAENSSLQTLQVSIGR